VRAVARDSENLLPAIRQALKDRCSIGEVCGAMQDVFGKYTPTF
jgi:methylmalonyl-CoA mutase N-terminal domain/subunit